MRFKEFKPRRKVDELMPAITGPDLKGVGGALIQATRNAVDMVRKKASTSNQTGTNQKVDPNAEPSIPAVGATVILPDKDTKKPGTFKVTNMVGGNAELEPIVPAGKTNQPKTTISVRQNDLKQAVKATSPETKDQRSL